MEISKGLKVAAGGLAAAVILAFNSAPILGNNTIDTTRQLTTTWAALTITQKDGSVDAYNYVFEDTSSKKPWIRIEGNPLAVYASCAFLAFGAFAGIAAYRTLSEMRKNDDKEYMKRQEDWRLLKEREYSNPSLFS